MQCCPSSFLWLSIFSQRGGGGILCLDGPGLRWEAQLWGVHGRGAADPIITIISNIEKISNIEIITNIAKVTFIINTKGPQFLGIFCVFGLTLESLFYNLSIFSEIQIVLWLHFPSRASFHLWVCPNLQCFDLLNFLFTNRPSPSSYKQNHKEQEQEKRSMQYFLLWTKCANIRKALLRNSSRTWTKMAMGLWLKRYTLSKTSNCFLS